MFWKKLKAQSRVQSWFFQTKKFLLSWMQLINIFVSFILEALFRKTEFRNYRRRFLRDVFSSSLSWDASVVISFQCQISVTHGFFSLIFNINYLCVKLWNEFFYYSCLFNLTYKACCLYFQTIENFCHFHAISILLQLQCDQ